MILLLCHVKIPVEANTLVKYTREEHSASEAGKIIGNSLWSCLDIGRHQRFHASARSDHPYNPTVCIMHIEPALVTAM